MSINFKEAQAGFIETTYPRFSKTDYGLDIAQVIMGGTSAGLRSYLLSLRQGSTLAGYGSMFLSTWDSEHSQTFPTVTLTYKGLLNGRLPDPLVEDTMSSGTAQGTSTSSSGGFIDVRSQKIDGVGVPLAPLDDTQKEEQRTCEILYSAPTRRFRYITNRRPTGPKFQTWKGGPIASPSILSMSIRNGKGEPRASAPGLGIVYGAEFEGFEVSPVPGTPFFECSESWKATIMLL